jgi:hypothetical protein
MVYQVQSITVRVYAQKYLVVRSVTYVYVKVVHVERRHHQKNLPRATAKVHFLIRLQSQHSSVNVR